jgi:hypothetical protein
VVDGLWLEEAASTRAPTVTRRENRTLLTDATVPIAPTIVTSIHKAAHHMLTIQRMVSTGQGAVRTTRSATLPNIKCATPVRPWVPITIKSILRAVA